LKPRTDILDHELIPRHVILTEDEKKDVLKTYGIKKLSQFPRILKSDPVIKELKIKTGDLIKIIRKTDNAKESIYYRVVVEG
jgi:DNA-directed RNA polymerase subunit H